MAESLARFVAAQAGGVYETALSELQQGAKRSHWIWFIFPQFAGLGRSATAQHYAIRDITEARAYLAHPVLAERLHACTAAMLAHAGERSARDILGDVDAMKFRSSMTLFKQASTGGRQFTAALQAFFNGEQDPATLELL